MKVVAVTPDVSAIEAMALMNEQHISAVAVVDSVGKIIGARVCMLVCVRLCCVCVRLPS